VEKNKSKEGNWTFLRKKKKEKKKEKNYYDFKVLIYHIIFYEIQTFLSYTKYMYTHMYTNVRSIIHKYTREFVQIIYEYI